jgi:hypothetical protein
MAELVLREETSLSVKLRQVGAVRNSPVDDDLVLLGFRFPRIVSLRQRLRAEAT